MIALNFATNLLGGLKPDVQKRLIAVVDNPNQETWDDAHCIIICSKGRTKTLWNAILDVDPTFTRGKSYNAPWPVIPTKEVIIQAIKTVVYKETLNNLN